LRHTAASLLLAQVATLHDVKEILGHSQIALTSDLYGHAYTSVMRQTVDLVGSVLAPQVAVAPSARRPCYAGRDFALLRQGLDGDIAWNINPQGQAFRGGDARDRAPAGGVWHTILFHSSCRPVRTESG
jgi:hypothetical protein